MPEKSHERANTAPPGRIPNRPARSDCQGERVSLVIVMPVVVVVVVVVVPMIVVVVAMIVVPTVLVIVSIMPVIAA
jgi:hypothetical protein